MVSNMMNIKVEEFADTQEVEDPIAKLPLIKFDHKVSCTLQLTFKKSVGFPIVSLLSIST
ncbi:hypothetical protein L798_07767 [Zootermopsis nevadensis]|uniref:Uncharacterized protein n=1 Tax=Zootermopsis nevadensis TaxID=136037 RepID=A0A067R7E1_ZOONE|nr:hypothetical protein L798_07767 [Zootermopsis nevadensis]